MIMAFIKCILGAGCCSEHLYALCRSSRQLHEVDAIIVCSSLVGKSKKMINRAGMVDNGRGFEGRPPVLSFSV